MSQGKTLFNGLHFYPESTNYYSCKLLYTTFLFNVSSIGHKAQTKIRATLFEETNLKFVKFVFNLLIRILKFISKLRRLREAKGRLAKHFFDRSSSV